MGVSDRAWKIVPQFRGSGIERSIAKRKKSILFPSAQLDYVQVESSSCCFLMEFVSFIPLW